MKIGHPLDRLTGASVRVQLRGLHCRPVVEKLIIMAHLIRDVSIILIVRLLDRLQAVLIEHRSIIMILVCTFHVEAVLHAPAS
jgi:hypothetical protein